MKVLTYVPNDEGLLICNIGRNLDLLDVINDLRNFEDLLGQNYKFSKVEITAVLNKDSAQVASYFSRPLGRG